MGVLCTKYVGVSVLCTIMCGCECVVYTECVCLVVCA